MKKMSNKLHHVASLHLSTLFLALCRLPKFWQKCVKHDISSITQPINTQKTVLWLSGFFPGQSGWDGTRRNIHPLTPIVVINRPLSASPIYYDPWHPFCL